MLKQIKDSDAQRKHEKCNIGNKKSIFQRVRNPSPPHLHDIQVTPIELMKYIPLYHTQNLKQQMENLQIDITILRFRRDIDFIEATNMKLIRTTKKTPHYVQKN